MIYVIDISSKYACVLPSKDKENIINDFQKNLNSSRHKPKKIWDKESELCNRPMKPWLQNNGKKCIQQMMKENLLLLKDCKYMTSQPKNMYIDKVDELVNEYNNTYHSATKKKSVDVKSSTYNYILCSKNDKDPKV